MEIAKLIHANTKEGKLSDQVSLIFLRTPKPKNIKRLSPPAEMQTNTGLNNSPINNPDAPIH